MDLRQFVISHPYFVSSIVTAATGLIIILFVRVLRGGPAQPNTLESTESQSAPAEQNEPEKDEKVWRQITVINLGGRTIAQTKLYDVDEELTKPGNLGYVVGFDENDKEVTIYPAGNTILIKEL